MSSLCRNERSMLGSMAGAAAAVAALFAAPIVSAQDSYFVPGAAVSAEWNSNRQLAENEQSSAGYKAMVEGYWKRLTQKNDTEIHPQITYQKYPNIGRLDSVEGMLELSTEQRTLRGTYSLLGRYHRQDTLNAELGQAGFDPTDPNVPDTIGTGTSSAGVTRTRYELYPSFAYQLSQIMRLEGNARLDSVRYETNTPNERVGYDNPQIGVTLLRSFGPQLKVGVGPYYSRFEADNNTNKTNSYGLDIDFRYEWSEVTRTNLVFGAEKDDITQGDRNESANAWSVRWTGTRRMRVGSVRYSIGRFLEPSSIGNRRTLDQFRVELIRPFSPRFTLDASARYARSRSIGDSQDNTARDRANVEIILRRLLTRTITLSGGYRYSLLDRKTVNVSTENHGAFLTLGFLGLDPHQNYQ